MLSLWVCRQACGGKFGLLSDSLNIQLNGIIIMSLDRSINSSELTPVGQRNIKLWEQKAKLL